MLAHKQQINVASILFEGLEWLKQERGVGHPSYFSSFSHLKWIEFKYHKVQSL